MRWSDFHFQKVIQLQGSKCVEEDISGRRYYGPELMERRHLEERGQGTFDKWLRALMGRASRV